MNGNNNKTIISINSNNNIRNNASELVDKNLDGSIYLMNTSDNNNNNHNPYDNSFSINDLPTSAFSFNNNNHQTNSIYANRNLIGTSSSYSKCITSENIALLNERLNSADSIGTASTLALYPFLKPNGEHNFTSTLASKHSNNQSMVSSLFSFVFFTSFRIYLM